MKNKNTYSLLLQSEEKGRTIFEGAIYGLVILCTAIAGWQFASSSVALPGMPANQGERVPTEMVAEVAAEPVIASRG